MEKIRVSKSKLLSVLKTNRAKHREIFLKAQKEYRKAAIKELDAMLAEARDGKKIRRSVNLIQPQDHTSDYDRAIRMVEWSIDDNIELSEQEFAWYVQNHWSWFQQFRGSTVGYVGTSYFKDFDESEENEDVVV